MEIQSLRVVVAEADLNAMAQRFVPAHAPIRSLYFEIGDGVIHLGGKYPAGILPVPFRTSWSPSIQSGWIYLRLEGVKVMGVLPAGVFRGAIMRGLTEIAHREPGVRIENETMVVELDRVLQRQGIPLRTNLRTLVCRAGEMTIEV